jgi:hypothetical protein
MNRGAAGKFLGFRSNDTKYPNFEDQWRPIGGPGGFDIGSRQVAGDRRR